MRDEASLHSFLAGYKLAAGIYRELAHEPPYSFDKDEEQNAEAIYVYAIPRIGDIKLNKLTSRDLQKLYKDLQKTGRVRTTKKGSAGLSSTTVRSVHLMLHCAFERAVKARLIQRNPTDDCIAPKVRKVEMHKKTTGFCIRRSFIVFGHFGVWVRVWVSNYGQFIF
jgi:hypothetical protein